MNKEEIEELAFKDRKELANLNELDLLEIIEFLQNDRKQWINQFTQTHNESIDIQKENKKLKDKLSKIENLIINHNCDTGDIYYKYNSKFLKSELKQRILEIVYEVSE